MPKTLQIENKTLTLMKQNHADMTIQYIIIAAILAIAIGYSAYKIYETISNRNNPCGGCKGCSMGQEQAESGDLNKKRGTCEHKM